MWLGNSLGKVAKLRGEKKKIPQIGGCEGRRFRGFSACYPQAKSNSSVPLLWNCLNCLPDEGYNDMLKLRLQQHVKLTSFHRGLASYSQQPKKFFLTTTWCAASTLTKMILQVSAFLLRSRLRRYGLGAILHGFFAPFVSVCHGSSAAIFGVKYKLAASNAHR